MTILPMSRSVPATPWSVVRGTTAVLDRPDQEDTGAADEAGVWTDRSSPSHPSHQRQPERKVILTKVIGIVQDHTAYVPVCIDNTVVTSQRSTRARIVTTTAAPDQPDQEDTGVVDEAGVWTVPVQPRSTTATVSTKTGAIPTEAIEIVNDQLLIARFVSTTPWSRKKGTGARPVPS